MKTIFITEHNNINSPLHQYQVRISKMCDIYDNAGILKNIKPVFKPEENPIVLLNNGRIFLSKIGHIQAINSQTQNKKDHGKA